MIATHNQSQREDSAGHCGGDPNCPNPIQPLSLPWQMPGRQRWMQIGSVFRRSAARAVRGRQQPERPRLFAGARGSNDGRNQFAGSSPNRRSQRQIGTPPCADHRSMPANGILQGASNGRSKRRFASSQEGAFAALSPAIIAAFAWSSIDAVKFSAACRSASPSRTEHISATSSTAAREMLATGTPRRLSLIASP